MKLLRHLTANEEQLESFPFKRELSMGSYLVENEGVLALDSGTFSDVAIIKAELTLKQGRSSKDTDGRIDILLTYSNEYIGVVELKLEELNDKDLAQLEDYLLEKDQIIERFPDILDENISPKPKWIGVLVGSSIKPDLAQKISQGLTVSDVQIAALTIQRFRGQNGGIYVTTDIYFKNNSTHRDRSQYRFNDRPYNKRCLVLAVVKQHINNKPLITFAELENDFPKNIQGSRGVFCLAREAQEIYENTDRKRHFIKPSELIKIQDAIIAVSSEWGIGNINKFVSRAKELSFEIKNEINS